MNIRYKYECMDCHRLITEAELEKMGEYKCPACFGSNLRELIESSEPLLVPA